MREMNDVAEDTKLLEEILNVPHCETHHHVPGVHKWAGDCSHTVVATFTDCGKSGKVCLNTVLGVAKLSSKICSQCRKTVSECWKITPL